MLNRQQTLVIVMAPSHRELGKFRDSFSFRDRPRVKEWGRNIRLLKNMIYVATTSYGIPFDCHHPITLIVLSAEKILHRRHFIEWCTLFPTYRRYGIASPDAHITPYDRQSLKIMLGIYLPCKPDALNPVQVDVHAAQMDCLVSNDLTDSDRLTWKRMAIWTNSSRNRPISNLVGFLDGTDDCITPEITLPGHSIIRERRGSNKHTLILVENEVHGLQIQALLPSYRLVELSNVNHVGFASLDERYQDAPGAIVTLAAHDALKALGGDLVIRADCSKAVLDVTKTIIPRPLTPQSQTVIEIAEPKQSRYGGFLQKHRDKRRK